MDRENDASLNLVDIHDDFKVLFVIEKFHTEVVLQTPEKL